MAQSDIKDYFYRFLLPEEYQCFFGLRPVDPARLRHSSAREWTGACVPCLCVMPMGWSWSVHFAQRAHEALFTDDAVLREVPLVKERINKSSEFIEYADFFFLDDFLEPNFIRAFLN